MGIPYRLALAFILLGRYVDAGNWFKAKASGPRSRVAAWVGNYTPALLATCPMSRLFAARFLAKTGLFLRGGPSASSRNSRGLSGRQGGVRSSGRVYGTGWFSWYVSAWGPPSSQSDGLGASGGIALLTAPLTASASYRAELLRTIVVPEIEGNPKVN